MEKQNTKKRHKKRHKENSIPLIQGCKNLNKRDLISYEKLGNEMKNV